MRLVHVVPAVLLILLVAACGGSAGSATTRPVDAPTDGPGAVASSEGEPVPTTASGGGSTWATKPCELLAQADVEQATGVAGMTPTPVPMDATSGLCGYRAADSSAWASTARWASRPTKGDPPPCDDGCSVSMSR